MKKPSDQVVVRSSNPNPSQNFQNFIDTNQILLTLRDVLSNSNSNFSGFSNGRNSFDWQILAGQLA